MSPLMVLSMLACIASGAGLIIAIRRIISPAVALPTKADWIDELSIERYRPMLRLLDDAELRFLCPRWGITPKVAADLRRQRCQIFRAYLYSFTKDFQRVCMALRLLMAQANTDRPDLASTLIRNQVAFACGMAVLRARLVLYSWGVGTVDFAGLLKLFDGMRLELRMLLSSAPPSAA